MCLCEIVKLGEALQSHIGGLLSSVCVWVCVCVCVCVEWSGFHQKLTTLVLCSTDSE